MAQEQSRQVGRPPIGGASADLHVRVAVTMYDAIAVEALRRNVPINQVVREALEAHIESRLRGI